jgi:macrolide-specific efflux system membrane fusion protein
MNKFKYLIILVILGAIVALGLNQIQAQTVAGASLKYNPKKHTLYTPKIETIQDTLTIAGSVDTDQAAVLRFQNSGKLVWVGVKIGDKVKRGQAIASLDKEELRKDLQTQFNNYRTNLSQFWDTQDKYKDIVVSDTIKRILNRTQYSLDNSVITYEIADMAIKESTLISPIDGIVVSLDQPLSGTNITPATATFTIINPNNIYFKADVDQDSINKIKVGQKVTLSLDSFPDQTIDSEITYIAFTPVSGQTSTVYETRFKLPAANNDLSYRLGMGGDVTLVLSQADNALTVPVDAVNDDNDQRYVYVYVQPQNQLIRRDVKVGIETDTTTQIIAGLSQNDQVAIIQK